MGAQSTGQQVQTPADERLKDSEEIQGNILAPFNKPHQVFLFVTFDNDQAAARQWLRRLIERVATTRDVAAHNHEFSKLKAEHGRAKVRAMPKVRRAWTGVGLTSWGLVTLHPELAADLAAYDAFWRGPLGEGTDEHGNRTAPAAVLGDPEQSDPSDWVVGGPAQPPVGALVTIAADDQDLLQGRLDEELAALKVDKDHELGVVELPQPDGGTSPGQWGATLQGVNGGIEHFGFKDGLSQPGIRGFTGEEVRNGRLENRDRPGSPIIATGEFVLGYPGERGSYLRDRRPNPPEWMRDGSFQVFLRLTQNVAGWLEEMERLGTALSEDVAAKVIGRRRDGTPLAGGGTGTGLNDFDYGDDPLGNDTPRFAHIRRANPRDDAVYNDRSHRLLRRGIPFGPFANDLAEARANPVERGLLLNAFMASIEDQFEVVQRQWASNADLLPVTPGRGGPESAVTDGPDPLIGASTHPCLLRRDGQDPLPLQLPRFVRTTGAVYAFAPSISTLRRLGSQESMRDR
jgi:Dyp-type peroxidase family